MNEIDAFRNLLLAIFDKYHVEGDGRPIVKSLLNEVLPYFSPFADRGALEANLPTTDRLKTDFLNAGQFLYLPPVETSPFLLPVLRVRVDFSRQPEPEIRLRIAFFLLDHSKTMRFFAYRFESPERKGRTREIKEGRHDYYHVQLIRELRDTSSALKGEAPWPDWLPQVQPAFALDAHCSVTLLISLLVSLYGLDFIDNSVLGAGLSGYVSKLHLRDFRPMWWEVRSQLHTRYYKTRAIKPGDLKLQLSSPQNRVLQCTATSLEKYYATDERLRMTWPPE